MNRRITATMLSLALWAGAPSYGELRSAEPAAPTTRWVTQRQVGRFHVFSDFEMSPDEPLLSELGDIEGQVTRLLAIPTEEQPIHVVLFASSKEIGRAHV